MFSYNKETKTFTVNGNAVQFATEYTLHNPKTGGQRKFNFSYSTGSEWDPKTRWVYKSDGDEEFTLEVGNQDVTSRQVDAYLQAKTQ